MAGMASSEAVTISFSDGEHSDELTVPRAILTMLSEGDDPAASVVADIALLGLTQQAHGAVHHGREDPDPALEAGEEQLRERFEERFGQSYAEMTGHSH